MKIPTTLILSQDVFLDLKSLSLSLLSPSFQQVPPLFSENFDYQTLSTDFIPGILTSDLLDSKIFLHISPSSDASGGLHSGWGYSSRVKDTKSYDLISKDVLSRWTFPLTPGANCPGGIEYSVRNGTRYVGKGVRLSR